MKDQIFYGEDRVIEIMQEENRGWLFYVGHNTQELFDEYMEHCTDNNLDPTEEASANAFIEQREEDFEQSFLIDSETNI